MTTSNQAANMKPAEYSRSLWLKELKFDSVYDESTLSGTFIEGLYRSIRHNMHAYQGSHERAMLQELACYTTLLESLQFGSG